MTDLRAELDALAANLSTKRVDYRLSAGPNFGRPKTRELVDRKASPRRSSWLKLYKAPAKLGAAL